MPAPNPFEYEGGIEQEISLVANEILYLWPAYEGLVSAIIENNTLNDWECCEVLEGLRNNVLDIIDNAEEHTSFWPASHPTVFDELAKFDFVECKLDASARRETPIDKVRKFVVSLSIELSKTPFAGFMGLDYMKN